MWTPIHSLYTSRYKASYVFYVHRVRARLSEHVEQSSFILSYTAAHCEETCKALKKASGRKVTKIFSQ